MTTKKLLRSYDALSVALASLQSSPRAERPQALQIVRSRASELMAALKLANSRIRRDVLDMAERLVDKATSAVPRPMKNFALVIAFVDHPAIVRWFGTREAASAAQRNHSKGSSQLVSYSIVSEEEFHSY